jgi:uncharacterized protein (DUF697 family)
MVTDYESRQMAEIEAWKRAKPDMLRGRFGSVPRTLNWVVDRIVPYIPLNQTFAWLDATAARLVDERDLIKRAGVSSLAELQSQDLSLSDRLAEGNHRWAMGMAAAEGAVTGVTGLVGLAADIPAIITLALRTIYRTGLCYGFDVQPERQMALGILAVSGANSMEEKTQALAKLDEQQTALTGHGTTGPGNVSKLDHSRITVRQVTHQLGVNLAKRKALQAVPMVGALVGGSVNAWYIRDVSWAARRVFQEQWLRQNHKLSHVAA